MSETDLWNFLESCTPEAKWFLKALQHFSSKAMDRAEIRIFPCEDPTTCVAAATHKSSLHIFWEEGLLHFSFKRAVAVGCATAIGNWFLPIKQEKAKQIIREFREALLAVPLHLGDILEVVKKIDDIIRSEGVVKTEEESD